MRGGREEKYFSWHLLHRRRMKKSPTNNALLINILLSSDAEIFVTNPQQSMQKQRRTCKNVSATCTCSDWASILRATFAGWECLLPFFSQYVVHRILLHRMLLFSSSLQYEIQSKKNHNFFLWPEKKFPLFFFFFPGQIFFLFPRKCF